MSTALLPPDNEFKAWWFTVPHHRRERVERHLEAAHVLKLHSQLNLERGQHDIWSGIRKNHATPLRKLSAYLATAEATISRWENGQSFPSSRFTDRYTTIVRNMAVDLYHQHLTELLWHLYWVNENKNTPEAFDPDHKAFHLWVTDDAPQHPLLTDLPPITINTEIPWPLPETRKRAPRTNPASDSD